MNATVSAFKLITREKIDSLNIEFQEYQHLKTKAKHIHLASNNKENVFMVALRTVPTDSSGVAHILEHTSLCGSEKYPVRDPFFMMIRRSLNTFMNAFTSADWTAYPFASQNKKDFNNLLDVYLDAVFFARLDPLDFAQEGHRLEFEEPENPNSKLLYKGVVFNEMKGAMSSISSQLWQAVGEQLFPDTTYGVNSGGEPADIPNLSYEQLQAFYQTHYHPDNAVFMTYGDIPAEEHQAKFETLALQRFSPLDSTIKVPLQKPFKTPKLCKKAYPLGESETGDNNTHRVIAWVLGDILDPLELMSAHLLNSVLMENSASPLQQVLETTALGTSPSPLCGMDDSGLQLVLVCGLQGCKDNSDATEFEQLIINTLEKIANEGVEQEKLIALLDQLELQQREISGDSYPYGLQIMLSCLATAMHRGNAANALNIDPILKTLRKKIQDTNFVPNLVKRLLLNNSHRVTLTLDPDPELSQKTLAEETKKLAAIQQQLNDDEKATIVETAKALQQRQLNEDDPGILPKVDLQDVPSDIDIPDFKTTSDKPYSFTFYPQGTNGITYRQIICPLPDLNNEEQHLLSLHNRIMTDVGFGSNDYLQTQNLQTRVCGSIYAFSSLRGTRDNEQSVSGRFVLSTKGLTTRSQEIDQLLHDTFYQARFDEKQRITDLIAQSAARAEQSVTGNGHGLAMSIACQGMSPVAKLSHSTSGILGIQRLKALNESLQNNNNAMFYDQLANLHQKLTNNSYEFLAVGENDQQSTITNDLGSIWQADNIPKQPTAFTLAENRTQSRELWVCNSQVNFCAKAYATVATAHADAPALTVLAGVLRNGFLHTAIREQGGAYGGGASQDSSSASFRFYSYRDPRLTETLNDFDQSIEWLLKTQHEKRVVEEAILGVIGSLDKPSSPAGTAKQHFHNALFGRTPETHKAFRNAVLAVTEKDLKRVAEQYLQPEQASIGIVTHAGEKDQYLPLADELGLGVEQL